MSFNGIPQTEGSDNLLGVYLIGKVVANDDPKHMERVKVNIPKLYTGDVANLPWVAPLKAWRFRNKRNTGEFGLVPEIGDDVIVMFQQGKVLYPMYVGYPHQADERPQEFITNYLKRYGWKDPEGNVLYFDTSPDATVKVRFEHRTGVVFQINNNGDILLATPGKLDMNIQGNTQLTTQGTLNLTSTGAMQLNSSASIKLQAPRIDLN